MTIQQFADQLKQEEGSPLLQALQALRQCSLEQVFEAEAGGWNPWGGEELMEIPQPIGG